MHDLGASQEATDPGLLQAVVFDLYKSLDKDACSEGLAFESLVLIESI